MYGSPEYRAWMGARARCENPKTRSYKSYGGRGIRFAERWKGEGGFVRFLEDVGRKPSKRHSLDRINNEGNYEPGNVRWATGKQQGRNKRTSHVLTVGPVSDTLSGWAERTGIGKSTIRERLDRGWTPERAVNTTPP